MIDGSKIGGFRTALRFFPHGPLMQRDAHIYTMFRLSAFIDFVWKWRYSYPSPCEASGVASPSHT